MFSRKRKLNANNLSQLPIMAIQLMRFDCIRALNKIKYYTNAKKDESVKREKIPTKSYVSMKERI